MAATAVAVLAGSAQAAVIGTMVDLGSGHYRFDVTNNDAVGYSGFDFLSGGGGFSGNFVNFLGANSIPWNTDANGYAFGNPGYPETYFYGLPPTVTVGVTETATSLKGAADYGTNAWLAAGATQTIALLTVSDQTAPTFVGSVSNTTTTVAITTIPEPSSLALLGLGGLLIARRRRA